MLVGRASIIIMLVGGASIIMYNLLQCIMYSAGHTKTNS